MFDSSSWDKGRHSGHLSEDAEKGRQRRMYLNDPGSLYLLHAEQQLECGEGKDLISLNEPRRKAKSLVRWPDLLSLDIAYWNDQQAPIMQLGRDHRQITANQSNPKYISTIPDSYINEFRGEWIRLLYNGHFVYGNLYSALHYIIKWALAAVKTWLDRRFPFQLQRDSQLLPYNVGNNLAYHQENHFSNELVKTYLTSHYCDWINTHLFDLTIELNHHLNHQTPATYIIEYVNAKGLPCVDFVCKNQDALRLIRPSHFVEDMQSMICDTRYLEHKAQELAAKIENEIRELGW